MTLGSTRPWSVLAWLRARKRRAVAIGLLAWLLLAQTALVVHLIDHASAPHRASCALCIAADHSAPPISEPVHAVAPQTPAPVAFRAVESAQVVLVLAFRSRAPPDHLRS